MKKTIRLTENDLTKIVKKVIKETWGSTTLIKLKMYDSEDKSEDEKKEIAKKLQRSYNGTIAIEFGDDEWYDGRGNYVDDINEFEMEIEKGFTDMGFPAEYATKLKLRRGTDKYDYVSKGSGEFTSPESLRLMNQRMDKLKVYRNKNK